MEIPINSEPIVNPEETDLSELPNVSEQDENESFAIVGIGASAGGLEPFTQLLKNIPTNIGMGFVLVQHLAPDHESHLGEILQHSTQMPVAQASDGMKIEPNSVYVIPPNVMMTLEQGVLKLEPRQKVRGKYMVIDEFFSSLAADRGSQAIAIVLSGSNEDGTAGLGVVKSVGGITFAQSIPSAEFPTMPMIAIASSYVDFILAPQDIAAELVKISQGNRENNAELDVDETDDDDHNELATPMFPKGEEALPTIFALLKNAMGTNFSHYKQGTVRRRIARRMGLLNLDQLDVYGQYLQEHPDEVEKLYHDILINVTSFFREPESFSILQQVVFPAICENKSPDTLIRIWVAGCSTGEEAYSIAMSLLEFFDDQPVKHQIQIFATDISELVINKARTGCYEQNLLTGVSPERLSRFFTPTTTEGSYQINKSVRELCIFARQNLTSDPPFSRLDLISCRNMLIYLEPILQKKIMPIFHYALNPSGFLMLGSSEGIGNATDLFEATNKKHRIYKRIATNAQTTFNFVKSNYESSSASIPKYSEPEPAAEINLEQLADQVVLSQYAPVGVTVNDDMEILQFRGQTALYLEPSPGKASLNLLKMVRSELKIELLAAIQSAKQQDIPCEKNEIKMSQGGFVDLNVIPLKISDNRYFLVLFKNHSTSPVSDSLEKVPLTKPRKNQHNESELEVVRLTHELESTKKYLRSIIETQEASNQDLKVASEEILSSNEELQSTNEELETAKEEIQATNEELSTINDELRSRNLLLQEINNDMQNLLSSVNIPILMLSGDLRIRRFTPMVNQVFNLISSDIGRPFSDIQSNIDVPNLRELITSVIDTLNAYDQEIQDRHGHWYSLRIRPYTTIESEIDGAVISLIDIDLIKEQKQQLITQNQALLEAMVTSEAANLAKSKFLGNMSHELRTPLNSILGFSQILKSLPNLNADAKKYLEVIYRSGEHLLLLIQDLLDISRIESQKMVIRPNFLSLPNFLQITVDMLNVKALEPDIIFTTQFAPDLPEVIFADEKRLRQVLLNLLNNAIKFTSVGEVTLKVSKQMQSTDSSDRSTELIKFAIADTGVGIDSSELEKIFLPFEQVGDENVKSQGTGLGLAISQSLIDSMGGEIKVISDIGKGSEFSFELDLIERPISAEDN